MLLARYPAAGFADAWGAFPLVIQSLWLHPDSSYKMCVRTGTVEFSGELGNRHVTLELQAVRWPESIIEMRETVI